MTRCAKFLFVALGLCCFCGWGSPEAIGKSPAPSPAKRIKPTHKHVTMMTVLGDLSRGALASLRRRRRLRGRRLCRPQVARYSIVSCCGGPGVYWDGRRCLSSYGKCGCLCKGPDCWKLFKTIKACQRAYSHCKGKTRKVPPSKRQTSFPKKASKK
ncbi:MAG: hypothetical protein EP343_33790 [Deltaproteobacteria bacterium]|nr:MAG: hypothetical protein EP343_33790 [Deltaproteobacteria bacterium]